MYRFIIMNEHQNECVVWENGVQTSLISLISFLSKPHGLDVSFKTCDLSETISRYYTENPEFSLEQCKERIENYFYGLVFPSFMTNFQETFNKLWEIL